MLKIIILKDNKPIDQCQITRDGALIGRKSDCDVTIKDPAVSGSHARLQKIGENYLIKDLGSTNGIHVGGQRVKQHVLKPGEVVTIGQHQLKFMFSPRAKSQRRHSDAGTKGAARLPPAGAFLKILTGAQAGARIPLEDSLTTIGVPGIQVAAVSKRPQGYFIIHVDGGKDRERVPLVNGEPTGFKSRRLELGDKIEVAGVEMEYCAG